MLFALRYLLIKISSFRVGLHFKRCNEEHNSDFGTVPLALMKKPLLSSHIKQITVLVEYIYQIP